MRHPGVLLGRTQLDFVKTKIAAGAEPWVSALAKTKASGYSSLSRSPAPVADVRLCGAGNAAWLAANPSYGSQAGFAHTDDAASAYSYALIWYYTRDQRYADKARQFMDAWSGTLTHIAFDQPRRPDTGGQLYDNGKLAAGWGASLWARAGEIIRHTQAGWPTAMSARFVRMLRTVHLPLVIDGWTSGANWLTTFAEAMTAIGVHCDDGAAFDAGVAYWRAKVPTTIYMPSDGPQPLPPTPWFADPTRMRTYWRNPTRYLAGLQGETLRDLSHMTLGMGAMVNAAATALAQGVDLFAEQQARIVACYELQARFVNEHLDGVTLPSGWPSTSPPVEGGVAFRAGWEPVYAEFTRKRGVPMPQTGRLIVRLRPSGIALQNTWETLTHAR